jgi:hypothetical protein
VTAQAQGAEPASPIEVRAQGSFPVQYTESVTPKSRQHSSSLAPYLDLSATVQLQPDVKASIFANGGHNQLGSFRDGDDTFLSFGASTEKKWDAFSVGASVEHTHYYTGTFGATSNIANDLNVYARYRWRPNPNLRITPGVSATMRLDEGMAVQRYSYMLRVNIEQWLFDKWWFVTTPRVRYLDYVGGQSGRRDTAVAVSAGLKYAFNDSVGFTMLAAVEDRTSNAASNRSRLAVGASVDFDVDFGRPLWPGGR